MGYLMIDGRVAGEGIREYDTVACGHCQAVLNKAKILMDGGVWKCSGCRKPMCDQCSGAALATNGACDTWEAKIERALKQSQGVQ